MSLVNNMPERRSSVFLKNNGDSSFDGDASYETADHAYALQLEEARLKLSNTSKVLSWIGNHQQYILLALWVAYSISAFIHDFSYAKAIFWANVFGIVVAVTSFVTSTPQFEEWFLVTTERVSNTWRDNRVLRIIVRVIVALGFASVVVYAIHKDFERINSAIGLVTFVFLSWAFSWKRNKVRWRPVVWGFGLQFIFAVLILRTDAGKSVFEFLGDQVMVLLNYTSAGAKMVFGDLAIWSGPQTVFAASILPTVIFFSSLVSILYYLNILQKLISVISCVMAVTMGTSASESLSAAGNIFVGMTEAPLLVRPFLKDMTNSELHAIMTGGFATIAGGVLAIYVKMGISASHLLAASVMSAPACLALSKLVYPETEDSPSAAGRNYKIESGSESNLIEAASNGASTAINLALNIGAMLIAFVSIFEMLDQWILYFGSRVGWSNASFQEISGYVLWPVAWLLGTPKADCQYIASLIGKKVFVNEFVAYLDLKQAIENGLSERATLIATYALCGFSNFASIGVQLGGLIPLAPSRKKDLVRLVMSSMITGNVVCFVTACIAGILSK